MQDSGRFVPIRRRDLLPLLLEEREDDERFLHAMRILCHVLRFESEARSEPLRDAYASLDPDPLAPALAGRSDRQADETRFLSALHTALEEANFERLGDDDLTRAFHEKSLFPLLAEVRLEDYEVLRMYYRGVGHRKEKVRGWSTWWRWREKDVDFYERLVVALRLNEEALTDRRHFAMVGMKPGKVYLKAFKNVPRADVEMVLPNTRLKIRPVDRALIGVPLAGGVLYTIWQSLSVLAVLATGTFALALDDPRLKAIGGVLLVLAGYLWRSHSKLKTTKLEYLKTLSEGLYFRNLANNAAVLDQVLAMADDEEAKEALLAYHFLSRDGAKTAQALDAQAEAWVLEKTGARADFDVHDGLACLEGLGLTAQEDGIWHAVPPKEAAALLDARWDAAFGADPHC